MSSNKKIDYEKKFFETLEELLKLQEQHYDLLKDMDKLREMVIDRSWILSFAKRASQSLNRANFKNRIKKNKALSIIKKSNLFDSEWYLSINQDLSNQELNPIDHYYTVGWLEGRDPSLNFSTVRYLREYPDVAESGINPLLHFIQYGQFEDRQLFSSLKC